MVVSNTKSVMTHVWEAAISAAAAACSVAVLNGASSSSMEALARTAATAATATQSMVEKPSEENPSDEYSPEFAPDDHIPRKFRKTKWAAELASRT